MQRINKNIKIQLFLGKSETILDGIDLYVLLLFVMKLIDHNMVSKLDLIQKQVKSNMV